MYTLDRSRQLRLAFNYRYNMSDNVVVHSAIYLQMYARMAHKNFQMILRYCLLFKKQAADKEEGEHKGGEPTRGDNRTRGSGFTIPLSTIVTKRVCCAIEGEEKKERRERERKGKCAARVVAMERYAGESYINYSDVICMLMGYICMSSRKLRRERIHEYRGPVLSSNKRVALALSWRRVWSRDAQSEDCGALN